MNQLQVDLRNLDAHNHRMQEINESPRLVLIAAVFCAIIGLIAYAGFMH